MAGRGPAPKTARLGKAKDPVAPTMVAPDEEVRGPELPALDGLVWHPMTVAWWDTWRRSPQAQTFLDTDWSFLLDTALMHSAMWGKRQWTLAAEVRLRAAKFGATPEDRARLRLKVTEPETPQQAGSLTGRTARFKVVADDVVA